MARERKAVIHQTLEKSQKPVILLDVDGVINIRNDHATPCDHTSESYRKQLWKNVREHKQEEWFFYSPTVVRKINAWSEHAEIIWLTSRGEDAPSLLAPGMKMKAFPYLPYTLMGSTPHKTHFAQQAADEVGPDRLIIWLDDDLKFWVPNWSHEGGFTLPYTVRDFSTQYFESRCASTSGSEVVLRPNTLYVGPWCGLSPNHLDLVDKYLADPSLAAGKAIYELDGVHERTYTEGEQLKDTEHFYNDKVYSDFRQKIVTFPIDT